MHSKLHVIPEIGHGKYEIQRNYNFHNMVLLFFFRFQQIDGTSINVQVTHALQQLLYIDHM